MTNMAKKTTVNIYVPNWYVDFRYWNFNVFTDGLVTRDYIKEMIIKTQKENKFDSVVSLMDYVCEENGWNWSDIDVADVFIELEMEG